MFFRRRTEQARALRYMAYVSDTKIDMLISQIQEPLRRSIATELKLDLKLIGLTLNADSPLRQQSRIEKVALVEDYLARHQQVGDLTATQGYVRARLNMDWAPLSDIEPGRADAEKITFFCGYTPDLLVVLGGSTAHLLGTPVEPAATPGSQPYAIRRALQPVAPQGTGLDEQAETDTVRSLADGIAATAKAVFQTPQPVQFLARCISRGPLPDGSQRPAYLLGSPLYVEMVDF
ncbi:DUF7019 family protein [Catellatospora bangladeshensis]|uniref:Uncharacterized protein n=1 Tax=Catellatospora bangladeshensis TaxID=310355 RepID=A0A8J3JHT9_9ACTN|nr:SAVMC3_10250 family protein [Catellatospora bangladeshensis]GIF82874.1 hypothetical protein Cba03nite_42230 [Catellatospora bangladeshensis]